jgi:phosphoribosylamine--glycine ligase
VNEHLLLVGGGGREHAIARSIREGISDKEESYQFSACASNRNPGIVDLADRFETLEETDQEAVSQFAQSVGATLAVVGPDDPIAEGVVDALEAEGVYTFGPTKEAARIEWDKQFQREFMRQHDIPGCPEYKLFQNTDDAQDYALTGDLRVLKPAGLTGGKGVRIIGEQVTREEAADYIDRESLAEVVFEEKLAGVEFTLQAFVANDSTRYTPLAHDHGRAFEGDSGPNTGGMGSFTSSQRLLPFVTESEYERAKTVMDETLDALMDFEGVLYGQFMLTGDGPKVVEYNARFGDPEAMNTISQLETNFLDVLLAAKAGEPLPELDFASRATVCKYAVPDGYPNDPTGGSQINPTETVENVQLFYASVDEREDAVCTTTSRAFAYLGTGDSISEAQRAVERAFDQTDLTGLRVRHDIGTEASIRDRIETVEQSTK